ncbi:hypothetical protein Ddye_031240 [Dipteronia dyeriana]|uniref:Reverse transcriptase zinc-binding domain-containing protein n=1 Tax=Dipteronia dyeriana TaxID=168575 RepID=A0AAD9TIH0_9ROSI|nr:hypothetical protein Ddye_031240 [Dipteronia dyeriana]
MATDASCPMCQCRMEDVDHLVRGCRDSIVVWEDNFECISSSAHFLGNLKDWFSVGLRNSKMVYDNVPSYLHFAVVFWFIWKWRCNQVFDADFFFLSFPIFLLTDCVRIG